MQNKKGIKVKAKDTSIIDNVVNFFKKDKPNQQDHSYNLQIQQKSDLSPRSTTPRKKIFNKTPQKAGTININKNNPKNNDNLRNLNNKTMDAAYQITFNDQLNYNRKSNLSPRKNINVLNPLGDTQFNKLILDNSKSINQYNNYNNHSPSNNRSHIPQKTFLSQNNSSSQNIHLNNKNLPVNDKNSNVQHIRNLQKQIQHHKRLNQELKKQNFQLIKSNENYKKQNQNFKKQIQQLNKKLTTYQTSNKNNEKVQISHLQHPKSPFDKEISKKVNIIQRSSIIKEERKQKQFIKGSSQSKNNTSMKQSIPILPDISYEYSKSRSPPRMQQMSLLSLNLKNISQQSSFFSQETSFDQSQNIILKGLNKNDKNKNSVQNDRKSFIQNENHHVSSDNPFTKIKSIQMKIKQIKYKNQKQCHL